LDDTVNIMKLSGIALFFALVTAGTHAFADEAATGNTAVETYAYGMNLDIQKVIATSDTGDQCGPVPVQMTYEDSHGQQHVLQYQIMGTGCSNG